MLLKNTEEDIKTAAELLKNGGVVGIPTETVYGLAADALNPEAVKKIFKAKGRPGDNPLIVHICDFSDIERLNLVTKIPDTAKKLADAFWPGPLTMIMKKSDVIPNEVSAGLDTVAIRFPSHKTAQAIIRESGTVLAAPSANISGSPSPTTAQHVMNDMDGKIDAIFDGGPCRVGVESTIIDLTCQPARLLRPGGLPLEMLEDVLGEVAVDKAVVSLLKDGEKPKAPGMKYRHYAPKAPVTVFTGDPEKSARYIEAHLPASAGVICFSEFTGLYPGHIVHDLGSFTDKAEQARRVFDALREFDHEAVTEIYAQCPDASGLGLAIGNRLKKAAGFHIVEV